MVICKLKASRGAHKLARGRRAVQDDLKALRREDLLNAAAQAFDALDYDAITMASVAGRAGVAKGTAYLYFNTKEELFLAVMQADMVGWFDAFDAFLARPVPADRVAALVEGLAVTLEQRPRLLRLIGLAHAVLERNVNDEVAQRFKRLLAQRVAVSGGAVERWLGWPADGSGSRLLLWSYAAVIGLQQLAEPAAAIRRVIDADPSLVVFKVDFGRELRAWLRRTVEGCLDQGVMKA